MKLIIGLNALFSFIVFVSMALILGAFAMQYGGWVVVVYIVYILGAVASMFTGILQTSLTNRHDT